MTMQLERKGILFVVSGPSGVGKGTVITEVLRRQPEVRRSISCTTRPPRPGEQHGRDYYFISEAEFMALRETGRLLEWAIVHKDLCYGTPRAPVEEALAAGADIMLEIDYQGALSVRRLFGEQAVLIFLAPPSWQALIERLRKRSTEDSEAERKRLASAHEELSHVALFDYLIVNEEVEEAARHLEAILLAERVRRQRLVWEPFVAQLLQEAQAQAREERATREEN